MLCGAGIFASAVECAAAPHGIAASLPGVGSLMAEISAAYPAADQAREQGCAMRLPGNAELLHPAFQLPLRLLKSLPAYDGVMAVFHEVLRQLPTVSDILFADMVQVVIFLQKEVARVFFIV